MRVGYAGAWGYQEDRDSGYYDPSTGRFLTRDSVKEGRNWYSYCENGPTVRLDPNGLGIVDWIKEKWYDLTVAKEPIDVIKPPAAGLAASVMAWAIWKLADVAHGPHEPPGGNPRQPGPFKYIPGPSGYGGRPNPGGDPSSWGNNRKLDWAHALDGD